MFRLQYQNRAGVEALVSNFTVNVSGVSPTSAANYQAGFRYFELKKNSPGGLYGVTEQATFAPGSGNGATGPNRWMASAASDNQDNLLVGYSISSTTIFPSLNYAARAFNDPANGLFHGEGTLFAGTGVQRGTSNRWGDYSSTQLDPSDDCTFWMANEYYTSTNLTFNWRTRIGRVKFASCTAPPQGTLAGTVTACDTGVPLAFAMVQVSGGPSSGFSTATIANGTYSMQLAPGNYSVTVSASGHLCNPVGPFNVTITDGLTTTLNTCLTGQPTVVFQSAAISGGNGNGVIDFNECNNLNVTIKNDGCLTATNIDPCVVVTFPPPVASDNCPGVTASCNPPSGSCFPVGTTTVTCTATDTSGNTATCTFTVTVFNVCLQDDSNPSIVFLGNTNTGAYRFCCAGTTYTGVAVVTKRGSVATFQHNAADRRVLATDDEGAFKGTASLQSPPGTTKCTIADRDTRNNSCVCP